MASRLTGPFSPQELLRRQAFEPRLISLVHRPTFLHYVQFLEDALGYERAPEQVEAVAEESDAVQLLHSAAASGVGSAFLIDFLIGEGHAAVDGHCSNKRLKAGRRRLRVEDGRKNAWNRVVNMAEHERIMHARGAGIT